MPKVENSEANAAKCKCPGCPTWQADECPKNKKETLFCAKGKTSCNLPDKGCVCGLCPLWEQYGLAKGYFCFSGEAE